MTLIPDRSLCQKTCRDFGDAVCSSTVAIKYDHDAFCKRTDPQCKCCCDPVCSGDVDQDDIDAAKKEFDKKMMKAKEDNEAEGKATEGDDDIEQDQGTAEEQDEEESDAQSPNGDEEMEEDDAEEDEEEEEVEEEDASMQDDKTETGDND